MLKCVTPNQSYPQNAVLLGAKHGLQCPCTVRGGSNMGPAGSSHSDPLLSLACSSGWPPMKYNLMAFYLSISPTVFLQSPPLISTHLPITCDGLSHQSLGSARSPSQPIPYAPTPCRLSWVLSGEPPPVSPPLFLPFPGSPLSSSVLPPSPALAAPHPVTCQETCSFLFSPPPHPAPVLFLQE